MTATPFQVTRTARKALPATQGVMTKEEREFKRAEAWLAKLAFEKQSAMELVARLSVAHYCKGFLDAGNSCIPIKYLDELLYMSDENKKSKGTLYPELKDASRISVEQLVALGILKYSLFKRQVTLTAHGKQCVEWKTVP